MPLTREFKERVTDRVQRNSKFRKELLRRGLEAMLSGEVSLAKTPCATTSTRPLGSPAWA
jgi:hypothetical protein